MQTLTNLIKHHKLEWASKSFGIFGVVWLLLEVVNYVDENLLDKLNSVLLILILSITTGFVVTWNLISKTKIRLSPGGSVQIKFGDIINAKTDYIIVPVNDFFDYEVGDNSKATVNTNSILGQLISMFKKESYGFQKKLSEGLSKLKEIQIDKFRKENGYPSKRFKIGTTVYLPKENQIPYTTVLLASCHTRFKEDGTIFSESSITNLVSSLIDCLNSIPQNKSIALPLIGNGYGRIGLNEKQLLEVLLSCVVEHSQRNKSKSEIKIILHQSLRGKFPLYTLKKEWKS